MARLSAPFPTMLRQAVRRGDMVRSSSPIEPCPPKSHADALGPPSRSPGRHQVVRTGDMADTYLEASAKRGPVDPPLERAIWLARGIGGREMDIGQSRLMAGSWSS